MLVVGAAVAYRPAGRIPAQREMGGCWMVAIRL